MELGQALVCIYLFSWHTAADEQYQQIWMRVAVAVDSLVLYM